MKKVLVLMLVLGMATMANATVIDVLVDGTGSISGNTGTNNTTDALVVGDIIPLKLVLNHNPYGGGSSPRYDGYALSSMDLDLYADGGSLVKESVISGPMGDTYYITFDSGFGTTTYTADSTGLSKVSGVAAPPILGDIGKPTIIVTDILLTVSDTDADGEVEINLGLNGTTQYSDYWDDVALEQYMHPWTNEWGNAVETSLGDLTLFVPEPMTIALLGLGGLFLRRKK